MTALWAKHRKYGILAFGRKETRFPMETIDLTREQIIKLTSLSSCAG